jgi:phytoene dehydrogenase-like protein
VSLNGSRRAYDAVVVGGGHNGLVAAAYLSRGGLDVCLLERRPMVGGASVTEELWPGYRLSTASYVVSLLVPQVVRDLELERFGYRVSLLDPALFMPFLDGTYCMDWADPRRLQEELRKFSAADADAYADYDRTMTELTEVVRPLLLTPPPSLKVPGDLLDAARSLLRGRAARRSLPALVDLMTMSVADFLRQWFSHPRVLVAISGGGVIGAWAGPETPGTAYVLLHHRVGETAGRRGQWGVVHGGMGALAEAIAASARWAGAEIRTGAPVAAIRADGGRVRGVTLDDGTEIDAPIVLSGVHPRTALLDLVGAAELPDDLVQELERYRSRSPVVKINAVVSELPDFTSLPGKEPGPQHAEFMLVESLDALESAWDDAKHGRASAEPFVDAVMHSVLDPSLVPEGSGHHTLSLFCQYGPYELADGGSWETERDAFADRVFERIGRYAPNLPDAVLHRQVLAPPDLEERFGLIGGNIFHGEMTLDQLFAFRPASQAGAYRTPVGGLYLCGSGSHPGGGVMGAPGYLGARTAMRDRRMRKLLRRR